MTGWTALVIVFIAGVTGYWLLWDERAQLINEATASVFGVFDVGTSMVTAILTADGSGWQVLLLIWFAHLLATGVIGYFLWRHLRRSKLPWLPPRLWTGLMVGALVLVLSHSPWSCWTPPTRRCSSTRFPSTRSSSSCSPVSRGCPASQ